MIFYKVYFRFYLEKPCKKSEIEQYTNNIVSFYNKSLSKIGNIVIVLDNGPDVEFHYNNENLYDGIRIPACVYFNINLHGINALLIPEDLYERANNFPEYLCFKFVSLELEDSDISIENIELRSVEISYEFPISKSALYWMSPNIAGSAFIMLPAGIMIHNQSKLIGFDSIDIISNVDQEHSYYYRDILTYFSKNISSYIDKIFKTKSIIFNGFFEIYCIIGYGDYNLAGAKALLGALYQNNKLISENIYTMNSISQMITEFNIRNFSEFDDVLNLNNIVLKYSDINFTSDEFCDSETNKIPYSFIDRNVHKIQFIILFDTNSDFAQFRNTKIVKNSKNFYLIHAFEDSENTDSILSNTEAMKFIDWYMQDKYPCIHYLKIHDENELYKEIYESFNSELTRYNLVIHIDKFMREVIYHDNYQVDSESSLSIISKKDRNFLPKATFDEIDKLIGLSEAKEQIKNLVNLHQFFQVLKSKKVIDTKNISSMHFVFTGNPGTGKTTVAKLYAEILLDSGMIKENKIAFFSRKDLIGKYLGHTENLIKDKFNENRGGVIFIDEAYSLASDVINGRGGYGLEAIDTIVGLLDEIKDDTCVIFAGYPKEMQEFINVNPGLQSRINFYVDFPDYSLDELIDIAKFIAKDKFSMTISTKAIAEIRRICTLQKHTKNFGNARFVRTLIDKALINHAIRCNSNIEQISTSALQTLTFDDFKNIDLKKIKLNLNKTGF